MMFSKSITFLLLASCVCVNAFKTPSSSLDILHGGGITSPGVEDPSKYQPPFHKDLGPSLNLWERGGATQAAVAAIDNGWPNFLAPGIYAIFTGILIYIIYELRDALVLKTPGSIALSFVTGSLIWDNLVITIGSIFFRSAANNNFKAKVLKLLSIPRFTLHAFGTPLQCITIAEMGEAAGFFKALGIGPQLQKLLQIIVIIVSLVLGIRDRKIYFESPGIKLDEYEDLPPDALERDLVKYTYVEPKFEYIIPAIVLVVFTIIVGGVGAFTSKLKGESATVANWLLFAGITGLIGNVPNPLMTFTGNLGEATLQYGMLQAARIVYAGNM